MSMRLVVFFASIAFSHAVRVTDTDLITEHVAQKKTRVVHLSSKGEELMTLHDLEAGVTASLHHPVHLEENCQDCFQGDILLPPEGSGSSLMENRANLTSSEAISKPWPNGVVYYKWKAGIHPEAKAVTIEGMLYWSSKTCLKFQEVTTPKVCSDHPSCFPVLFSSDKDGCNAHAGYYAASWQAYNLGEGCRELGLALHELGHVIGLSHEHERADRDEFITARIENVQEGYQQWFKVNPWRTSKTDRLPYDLSSIMHYDDYSFAKSPNYKDPSTATLSVKKPDVFGNCRIGQRAQLSIGDILTVKAMYDCQGDQFCADRHKNCKVLAEQKNCPGNEATKQYHPWMTENCPLSCGLCECKDLSPECAVHVKSGYCPHTKKTQYGEWMKINCAKSCGICGASDATCVDRDCIQGWSGCHKCSKYMKESDANGHPYCGYLFIQKSCPRSCGACPSEVFCY